MSLAEYIKKRNLKKSGEKLKVQIRRIRLQDAKDIKQNLFPVSKLKDIKKSIRKDLKEIKKGNLERFVLKINKEVIGNIVIKKIESLVKQHIAELSSFVISKKYQGGGYGSLLFNNCLKWAKEHGIEIILISVRKKTSAQKIYKHLGFKKYGELKGGIKASWEKQAYDEVFYYKVLK